MSRRGLRAAGAVTAALLALGGTASAHPGLSPRSWPGIGPWFAHGARDADLVASAQPSARHRVVTETDTHAGPAARGTADAETVATASATCDGCHGTARAVEVLDARWTRHLRADNVATAWAGCTDCGADAVSVQVVLAGPAPVLRLDNRALAVNGACTRCATRAAAYQVVLSGTRGADPEALRDGVLAWLDSGAGATGPSGSAGPSGPAGPAGAPGPSLRRVVPAGHGEARHRLDALERFVAGTTGGRVLSGTVRLDGGG